MEIDNGAMPDNAAGAGIAACRRQWIATLIKFCVTALLASLFGLAGVQAEPAPGASLLFGILVAAIGMPGGALWLTRSIDYRQTDQHNCLAK